jgi:hypothetical protein
MLGNPFENMIRDLLIIGAILGLGAAGFIWLAVWLFSHLNWSWS